MQRMFLSAPCEGEMQGKFKQFRNSFGKCQVNFNKNMHQPDFAAKPSTYFLNVFTEDTLVFQKQWSTSSLSQSLHFPVTNKFGRRNHEVDDEVPRSRRKIHKIRGGVKICENKSFIKSSNSCPVSKRMHSAKQQGLASDNMKRVTKEHKFDGGCIFQGESAFWRKPCEPLNFEYFHQQN